MLALGSNVGNRRANLAYARELLGRRFQIVAASRLVESLAEGGPPQGPYLNQVLLARSEAAPQAALAHCLAVEQRLGRVRAVRWGPRTLDVDLIWSSVGEVVTADLRLPHPRWAQRRFVVEPWLECLAQAPDFLPAEQRRRLQLAATQAAGPVLSSNLGPDPHPADDLHPAVLSAGFAGEWMGRPLQARREIDSTNAFLKAWAREGAPEGACVVADRQVAGRGRLGRSWWSPPGCGVYMSVLLRPPPRRMGGVLSLMAGLAVAEGVADALAAAGPGPRPQLKWPNDVLLGERKFAGVLVEGGGEPVPWVVVGMGINVNGALPARLNRATSLETATGRPWPRQVIFARVVEALERWYRRWIYEDAAAVIRAWVRLSATIGQEVAVYPPTADPDQAPPAFWGVAEGVDAGGALLVREGGGTVHRLTAGAVSIRPRPPEPA